jgi:hypothetical protein
MIDTGAGLAGYLSAFWVESGVGKCQPARVRHFRKLFRIKSSPANRHAISIGLYAFFRGLLKTYRLPTRAAQLRTHSSASNRFFNRLFEREIVDPMRFARHQ